MASFHLNLSAISPKVPLYKSGGTGRDTYVMHDSGGFVKASCADRLRGGMSSRPYSATRFKYTDIHGKTPIYISNGTGRDSYITLNSGGFTGRYQNANDSFLANLRGYDRPRTSSQTARNNYFDRAQVTIMGKQAELELRKSFEQKKMSDRLSTPRGLSATRPKKQLEITNSPVKKINSSTAQKFWSPSLLNDSIAYNGMNASYVRSPAKIRDLLQRDDVIIRKKVKGKTNKRDELEGLVVGNKVNIQVKQTRSQSAAAFNPALLKSALKNSKAEYGFF